MPPNLYIPPADESQPDPQAPKPEAGQGDATVDLIRQKVSQAYASEPNAQQELQETESLTHRTKHQQYMHELSTSGKDFATIQTEWHNYYQNLPDNEKHQVWQEFYSAQSQLFTKLEPAAQQLAEHKHEIQKAEPRSKVCHSQATKLRQARTTQQIQAAIKDKVSAGGKLQAKHHLQSLLFGLSMGMLVLLIFLFSFFNEVIIAPFIQPSRAQAATPLIISDNSVAPTAQPEVIIPKINVEIPVDYSQTTTNEAQIENALNDGVVHYPTTVLPGQTGNTAYFGHSSNNIFNKGKYKFAFVLLHTLVPGDTFYLTYSGKAYVYKVFSRTIVDPSDVGVLGPVAGHAATATLITCDPPGTSLHRLIVVGDQISPDPSGNTQSSVVSSGTSHSPTILPNDGPTLWSRFIHTFLGKLSVIIVLLVVLIWVVRWVMEPHRQLVRARAKAPS